MANINIPREKNVLRAAQRLHDMASAILDTYGKDTCVEREAAMESVLVRTMNYMERECRALDLTPPFGKFKPF